MRLPIGPHGVSTTGKYPRSASPQTTRSAPVGLSLRCTGASVPSGHYVVQPVWDSEDILYADLDMQCVPASRMELDVCGHYARPDVLRLTVQDA